MPTTTTQLNLVKLKQESYSTFASSTLKSLTNNTNTTSSQNRLLPDIRVYRNGPGPGKYSRGSSIGHSNHDLTLIRNPAYTIGKAKRNIDLGMREKSPGPNVYNTASAYFYSSKAVKSPGYYLCGRSSDNFNDSRSYARKVAGPAPGAYAPELHTYSYKRRVPAYSIGRAQRFPDYIA